MTCPMAFTTMEHAYALVGQWWLVSMLVFVSTTFLCWNHKWYRHLRDHSPMPEMRMLFIVVTVMVTANSWSVWRLWRCEDWDTDVAPLIVYILMIIALHGYVPALMVLKSLWLCAALSLIACGLAIAYTTLAFIEADTYAGIIGVFNIVWGLLNLGYTMYLNPMREESVLNKYYGRPDVSKKKKKKTVRVQTDNENVEMSQPPLFDMSTISSTSGGRAGLQLTLG